MPDQHQYVKISRQYYCLQQNPIALAWFLCFRSKSLQLRHTFGKKKVMRTVKALVQHQLHLQKSRTVLELPFYGNLCLKVHRGYRIFNYRRNTVVRMFDPEVDPAIVASEIEGVRSAGQLDCAPNVLRWNGKERWYEEDLVMGHPAYFNPRSGSAAFFEIYHQDVAPCLEGMILLQAPLTEGLRDYVDVLTHSFERIAYEPELDADKINSIRRFVESVIARLWLERDRQIDLVFSHGDFSLPNILRTRDGIRVIDWESAGRRSVLFDLHNYFFTELYYKRATTDLLLEIEEAISSLQSRLASKAPGIARTLCLSAQMYRWLYYVERILVLLDRELSDKVLDVILRSIEVFNRYEEAMAKQDLA